jgi:MFS superfamily sulfate permease-like transporter
MIHKHLDFYYRNLKNDIPAGMVVFLVALPLCLGIALASGAPLFSGLIAGMVGGLVISWASGSQLSVSGPAAGLTVIVYNAIDTLGSFSGFLVALVLAGFLQLIFGFMKAGSISAYFPTPVIKGMLAAIGLILIMKQIPHALGYDASFEGDESYMQETSRSTLDELTGVLKYVSPGATVVSAVSLMILMIWESGFIKRISFLRIIPGALLAVAWGVAYNIVALQIAPEWAVSAKHLVSLPVTKDAVDFIHLFSFPDFNFLFNKQTYTIAVTLAVIASLETLLSLEAVDKLDPLKRIAPTNRELKAQGFGNIVSGLIGGLPITAVIVRSAANVNAGGKSKVSAFVHGYFLLMSVMFFAHYLNHIPLACLAAILLQTGYKLAKPKLFLEFLHKGQNQWVPFIATVTAILITDLLKGILVGLLVGLYYVIRANYHAAISLTQSGNHYLLQLNKDVSFLNRALLRNYLDQIEEGSYLVIDGSKTQFIDHDILETIEDFIQSASDANITVETVQLNGKEKIPHSRKKSNVPRRKRFGRSSPLQETGPVIVKSN